MAEETLSFMKMQGAGNDFILFDNRTLKMSDDRLTELAPHLCNRKFGIGSDGIIALGFDETKKADLVMHYKNPDGSDAGMCGNGARCFAAFAVTLGSPKRFTFRVHDKVYRARVKKKSVVIHFPLETSVKELTVSGDHVMDVYTNTEHIVYPKTAEMLEDESMLVSEGRYLRHHEEFKPKGTNVNFISGINSTNLCLQTYERGVENLTLACGTGAIASALAWHHLQQAGKGDFKYTVKVRGGNLLIHFSFHTGTAMYTNIKLEGPAAFVFEGQYYF
jgi:diaminopimelate epimerase